MTEVQIRDAESGDLEFLSEAMLALNVHESKIIADRTTDLASAKLHLAYLSECIETQGGFILLAEMGGKPCGFLLTVYEEEEGSYINAASRRYADLSDLYVTEECRGCGVALRLVEAAELCIRRAGIAQIRVTALAQNREALAAYESFGYRPHSVTLSKKI